MLICGLSQRAYSIRTRIKTVANYRVLRCNQAVREHIPLEQGLRQPHGRPVCFYASVREHIPLEQGLRLLMVRRLGLFLWVREHIPLEQGLRRQRSNEEHRR